MRYTRAFALVILAVLTLALPISAAPLRSGPRPPAIKLSETWVSSTQVGLAWSGRFPAVSGFKIERSADQHIFIQIAVVSAPATNHQDTGLIPNTTYFYRARSFSAAGDSPYSNLVQVQTPGPTAPLALVEWGNNIADPPDGLTQLVAVAAGSDHQLALKADGTVVGWGDNSSGQAEPPPQLTNVMAIAAGGFHSLALKRDGTVVGWGQNDQSQATPPASLNKVVGIAAGGNHSLALRSNGTAVGWGDNSYGQAQPPANLKNVVAIAAGGTHSLALKANGTVVGWGNDSSGQIELPPQLTNVVAIAAGDYHSLALKSDGTVIGWGYNSQPPPDLTGVVAIAAGGDQSLALKSDGTVVQWGYNQFGHWAPPSALVGVAAFAVGENMGLALSILPGTPLRLAARIAATNQVNLSWHDNSANEDSFIIERALDPGFYVFPGQPFPGTWTQIATVGANVTEYEDTSVATNLTYRYRVSAHNQFGNSPPSLPVIVAIQPPSAPVWQMATLGSTNQIDLAWSGAAAVDGFRIERAPDAGGTPGLWSEINTLLVTNTSNATYTDTNVTALTTNWYRVRAFNVLGTSPYSDAAYVAAVPPPPPDYLSANAFRDQIDLSWNFYDNYGIINGFKIERAADVGGSPGPWTPIATLAVSNRYGTDFNYTDPNLAVNTAYWYRVRAFNWVGDGDYSSSAGTTIVPPAAPTYLSGEIGVTNHQVNLSWNEYPADEDGFKVERAPDRNGNPGTWTEIGTVMATNAGNASYTDMKVTALTTNWYRVRAFNGLGASSYSDAASVQVVPPPAPYYIYDNVFRDHVSLYWNFDSSYGAVNGFKIERAQNLGGRPGAWVQIASVANGDNYGSYTDTERTSGATYWYRVRAFNWIGNGDYSSMVSAMIVPPSAPVSLGGQIGPANHQIVLSWYESSADQNGFQIERASDNRGNPGTWTQIGTLWSTNTSYVTFTDANSRALTTNWYRVRAFNGLGTSSYSAATSVQVVPPPAPDYLSANAFRDQINLSWSFNYNYGAVNGFKIERALDVGGSPGTWAQIASVASGSSSYTDTNRPTGVTSWYRVRAFNWVGNGGYSPTASATITPPAAPTDLSGRIGTTNQVNLSWYESPADEDGFSVERAPDNGGSPGPWTEIGTLLATNFSYVSFADTNVTALTTNWYRVRAFNSLGTSSDSEAASVQVMPPPPPNYLYANAFRDQIALSWDVSFLFDDATVDGFEIERAPDVSGSPGTWAQIASVASSGDYYYYKSYTDLNLTVGVTYWYWVRAFNWVGNSDYSPLASATIVPPAAPSAPYGQVGTTNQVNLSWYESSADEDGFSVERAPDAGGSPGTWTEIGTLLATNYGNVSYTDTNVTALTTNWYRVRAFNNLGTSAYSQAASVQVVPPAAPSYLSASVFRDQINLTWFFYYNNVAVNGFKIERAPDVGGSPGTWAEIVGIASGNYYNSYNDTSLAVNTTYWYRVRAWSWVGGGDYSQTASAMIVPPAAPTSLYCQIGTTNQVNLSWNEYPADEDGFRVERAPDAGGSPGTWTEIGTVMATNTSYAAYTDTNVTALTTNWYRVRAFNNLGTSSYGDPASVQIVPPPAPDYLDAYVFRDQISLSWYFDYSYGAVNGFKIERAPDVGGNPGAWVQIAITASDANGYTDVNRAANKTYWYRVRAFNWVGNGDYSPTASATIVPPVAPAYFTGQVGRTNHQVNLSWYEPSADQDGFQIDRAPDNSGSPGTWSKIGIFLATNTAYATYTDATAKALTTYWYRVRAFNGLGTSSYSEATSVQVVPPPAPDYLSASVFRDQISLSWSFNSSYGAVDGFKIERAPDVSGSPGTWAQIVSVASSYDSYTDTNRTGGVTYWYRVRAFNWVGDGSYSPTASATVVPPAAPTNLYGLIGTTNQVNLSWSDSPADEDGFRIERAPDSDGSPGTWTEIGTLMATNIAYPTYTDTNVTALTTNWYRVRAFNGLGTSAYSQVASVKVVPPPALNNFSANAFRDQVNLSWYGYYYDDSYGIVDGFKVERAPDVGGSPGAWVQIATVGFSYYYGSYTDTNRPGGATYWYRVRALNWVGDGDYCPAASVTIVPPAPPNSLNGQIGTTNQVNLSWYEPSADQDGFEIDRAPDSGGSPGAWTEIGTVLATNVGYASYTDTNVTALTTNWYRVRAFNSLGTSSYSQATSVQVVPPLPPTYFYDNTYGDQVNLYWYFYNYNEAVNGLEIERAPDVGGSPGVWAQIASVASSFYSNYADTNVTAGATYWYRARAFDWVGEGDYSQLASATVELASGAAAGLVVPNPVAAQVRITSLIATNCDVLVVWQTIGGTTNVVEASSSLTEGFTGLSRALPIGGSGLVETNFLDAGALTNAAQRFYRVKLK